MTLDHDAERARLTEISGDSVYAVGANGTSVRYATRLFARFWRGGSCLELGPAEGVMTGALAEAFGDLVLVDGSEQFAASLAERFPEATVHHSLFEDFEPGRTYDAIMIGCVLEHVDDPVALLRRAAGWLAPGGSIYLSVPNARSLHRQAGVLMGLLDHEHTFTEEDRHNGHRRVYDPERLRADIHAAGLRVAASGGWWLKPVANAQIDDHWPQELLDAHMAIGERYPDVAAVIYAIAQAPATG